MYPKLKLLFSILAVALTFSTQAQDSTKKVINNEAYDGWKSLQRVKLTPSGLYTAYEINPAKGDGWLYFQNVETNQTDSIYKGSLAKLHYQDKFAVFKIKPGYDTMRTVKLDKVKKNKWPKDSLGIIWFGQDSISKLANIKSFKLAQEGDWLAYLHAKDLRPNCPTYKKWQIFKRRRPCTKIKTTGLTLTVMNPISGESQDLHRVKYYTFSKDGQYLAYTTSRKGDEDSLALHVLNLENLEKNTLLSGQLGISKIKFDDDIHQLICFTTTDTSDIKTYSLAYWKAGASSAQTLVDTNTTGLKPGWAPVVHSYPYFSHDGSTIYFGSNTKPEQEPKDSLLPNEKAKVDVWSWTDKKAQPQQLLEVDREKKRSFLTAFSLSNSQILHLEEQADEAIYINRKTDADYALYRNVGRFQKTYSWAFPWPADYGVVNLKTGVKKALLDTLGYFPSLAPSTNYLVWYNGSDSTWMSTDTRNRKTIALTHEIDDRFFEDNNGSPYIPYPNGTSGWTLDGDQERILINSEFDIWSIDPTGSSAPICVTKGIGKTQQINYDLGNFDRDSVYVDLDRVLLLGQRQDTKAEFISTVSGIETQHFLEGDYTFSTVMKAKKSDRFFFRTMSVQDYPELFTTTLAFDNVSQLTHTNPQQKDYNWATVEMIHWTSYKGLELDGLLYKPEDFDSTKQYPMIVYFYEKYDDRMHQHYAPRPTASIVYPTEYASNGYIVFIPNIHYTPGHPAQSAYDCILSGTDYLTQKYNWIDTTKLGLQGQSWGGYQTAQLITMTDKYACAMAGAPVSNMFSAYGGIRWGSGMSRMFQYERTQSRIGCTIWECPELYIENSPIFGLPNVHTPLLIMHNDNDGAVPWYQGIEMFMGMRRLEKPVWMLNYNGDSHNLRQNANKEDLSLRMRQFFDFYLKDQPISLWMKAGVPAVDKGDPSNLKLSTEQ